MAARLLNFKDFYVRMLCNCGSGYCVTDSSQNLKLKSKPKNVDCNVLRLKSLHEMLAQSERIHYMTVCQCANLGQCQIFKFVACPDN